MTLKVILIDSVLDYLKNFVLTSKQSSRRIASGRIFDLINNKTMTPLFAFQNEQGERYLTTIKSNGQITTYGDESDWDELNFKLETDYVDTLVRKGVQV